MLITAIAIEPNGDDPTGFVDDPSTIIPERGYGGMAPLTDIGRRNINDGTALTLLWLAMPGFSAYSAEFLAAQVAHETGHLFGLSHGFGNDPATLLHGSGINTGLLRSDLMFGLVLSSRTGLLRTIRRAGLRRRPEFLPVSTPGR
jgi:hypothetical protein